MLTFAALLVMVMALDALVHPRPRLPGRSLIGLWLMGWTTIALFGLFLMFSGSVMVAGVLVLALAALFALASNAKHAMLGEPLLFSDLALVGAVFRHPQFYLSAVRPWQRVAVGLIALALVAVLAWLFDPAVTPHLAGAALLVGAMTVLALSLRAWRARITAPDAQGDVRRHGLVPVLLLYWRRWRASQDPAPCPSVARHAPDDDAPELVIVIQCESFADPHELFSPDHPAQPDFALPGLAAARAQAWQWGRLEVSGFGAYTMRTEYGVLFGRDEDVLGFRRYDPFLTALGEASYALPARLQAANWRSLFVHPHDMRFYGRDAIMPAAGFDELVGEERFDPPRPEDGRYVTDAAMADAIHTLASQADGPTMIYAVTIENHGPWAPEEAAGAERDLVRSYLRLVGNSDAMLATLVERMVQAGRPAMLVFFGDHRPSIPGATRPGGARHTPYVMVRLDAQGQYVRGSDQRIDLTPAQLHHAVLDVVLGARKD